MLGSSGEGKFVNVLSSSFYCQLEQKHIVLFHQDRFGIIPFGVGCDDIGSFLARLKPVPDVSFFYNNFELVVPTTGIKIILKPKHAENSLFDRVSSLENKAPRSGVFCLPVQSLRDNITRAETRLQERKDCHLAKIRRILIGKAVEKLPVEICRIQDLWSCYPLDRLLHALQSGDVSLLEWSLNQMIGLGTGLTPTMDDVLTGLVYTLNFYRRMEWRVPPSTGVLLEYLSAQGPTRTTEISGAYLHSAAMGDIFTLMEEMELSLCTIKDSQSLIRDVDLLLDVGSDSGGNMLVGILLGLSLCCTGNKITHSVSE